MIRRTRSAPRPRESGFALLLVFLMAAVIAICLYMEIPRVAFETQRQKEQLLIERGEQYKRAIYMYWRTNHRYPAKMEDLEDSTHRFLRHRYIDPMTGKEEWRLVHINNGMLTDSHTMKPKQQQGDQKQDTTAGQYVGEQAGLGQAPINSSTQGFNPRNRTRPSDSLNPGISNPSAPAASGDTGAPGDTSASGATPGAQPNPGQVPPVPGSQPFPPAIPGLPGSFPGNTGTVGAAPVPGSQPSAPGQPTYPQYPGMQPMPGSFPPGASPSSPGMSPPGTPNPATQMIQNLLTQPRPFGTPTSPGAAPGGQVIGGGIAGLASKLDADSIMVYNDQTNYSDWEFIFDPAKVKVPPNPLTNAVPLAPGQATPPGNANPASPFGTSNPTSPFGSSSPASPFGSQPGQTGAPIPSPFGQAPGR